MLKKVFRNKESQTKKRATQEIGQPSANNLTT